jgi:glucan phosphoethanolaminetransferase (alkaline phosphatase superfamily)
MIQRIQSLLLALVVILGVLFSYLPILEFTGYESTYIMNAYKTIDVADASNIIAKNMGVGVMQGLVFLTAIVIIILFKNRQLQMKLAKLNILLISLQIAAIVLYSDTAKNAIGPNVNDIIVNFKLGAIIPVISLILTYLAIRFIKKDENLVRAADRLR